MGTTNCSISLHGDFTESHAGAKKNPKPKPETTENACCECQVQSCQVRLRMWVENKVKPRKRSPGLKKPMAVGYSVRTSFAGQLDVLQNCISNTVGNFVQVRKTAPPPNTRASLTLSAEIRPKGHCDWSGSSGQGLWCQVFHQGGQRVFWHRNETSS